MEPWLALRLILLPTRPLGAAGPGPGGVREGRLPRRRRVVGVPDTDGLGPDRQVVVRGGLLGFCERPAEGGGGRGLARVLPGLDGELLRDVRDGDALVLQCEGEGESSSMTFGRPPWLPLAAAMAGPSRVFSRM